MSTFTLRLRTGLMLATVLMVAALLPGCGCGGHDHHDHDDLGTLEIVNDPASTFDIEGFDIHLVGGGTDHYDLLLTPNDTFSIDLFPDDYTVTLYWSDLTTDTVAVSVLENFTTTVTGLN
jgi:hypothetical protein